ncbi:hypothetical protein [Anaerococcus vaginalis]|uniref:hypothetical protein n=1 Tax=Anaerococcus vaginalis TaxID=33037 RepID=UPI0022E53616|nr:hypothetical protein [Anaerococcus vaginalis]
MKKISTNILKLKYIEGPWGILGFPYNSTDIQVKKTISGYLSEVFGLNSIDYVYKKYIKNQNIEKLSSKFDYNLADSTNEISNYLSDFIKDIRLLEKPDIPSLFTASVAFFRLENTFNAVLLCIRTGLFAEAFMLERIILEQIAWIYQVHNYNGDFFKLIPSMSISSIKKIFPESGRLYGILSDFTHIDPKLNWSFVNNENNADALLIMYNSKLLIWSLKIVLDLLDMYCIVGETIYKDLISDYKHINEADDSFKENRKTLILKNDICRKFNIK